VGRKTNKQRRAQVGASAREKAAIARAEQQRIDQRRRAVVVLSSVLAVVLVGVLIAVVVILKPTKSNASGDRSSVSATVLTDVSSVSAKTLQTIGKGNVLNMPTPVTGQPPLTLNGKPEVLYIGAEFCPYCAAERWALYESLSKFGTFSNVTQVKSGTSDGNYSSLDFYKASFTSKYLSFVPIENEDRNRATLEKVTTAQNALWSKISNGSQGFPFIDFGNKYAIAAGAPLDPSVLGTLTQAQIASQLNDPTSKLAQTIGGGANDITAAICTLTNNQPASVCSAPQITSLQSQLNA
jgi:hypothetical protein